MTKKSLLRGLLALPVTASNQEVWETCARGGARLVDTGNRYNGDTYCVYSVVVLNGAPVALVTFSESRDGGSIEIREISAQYWAEYRRSRRASFRRQHESYMAARKVARRILSTGGSLMFVDGQKGGYVSCCGQRVAARSLLASLGKNEKEVRQLLDETSGEVGYGPLSLFDTSQSGRPGSIEWEMTA